MAGSLTAVKNILLYFDSKKGNMHFHHMHKTFTRFKKALFRAKEEINKKNGLLCRHRKCVNVMKIICWLELLPRLLAGDKAKAA